MHATLRRDLPATLAAALSLAAPARADISVFFDAAEFQARTGAAIQPPFPDLGLIGRHTAQITLGDLTYAINSESPQLALILTDFTPLHPGAEIGLSDWEALNVDAAFPVYALGSFFVEPTDIERSCGSPCPCFDATYAVRLLMGAEVVGQFTFNAPDDVLSFVGVWSDLPFDRVEYRDQSQRCDNEYWGRFFIGLTPRGCPADFNQDGFLDFFDYDDYVNCFETGACPPGTTADFNNDGFADFFDYDDFVAAFQAGC